MADVSFESAERVLARAEQDIRLLDRLVPMNLPRERARINELYGSGQSGEPRFDYPPPEPRLAATRRRLVALGSSLEPLGPLGALLAERARELDLEASLAEAVGRPDFARLAAARYPAPAGAEATAIEKTVSAWLAEPAGATDELLIRVDDASDPESLISVLRAKISAERLPVRVDLRGDLPTIAAAGDGFVAIRSDAKVTAAEAERIACHELTAHAAPRVAARREGIALFRVGARGSSDEEEGRALLIEDRLGLSSSSRRRELALRHRASEWVRQGAPFSDVVRQLQGLGADLTRALDLAQRALRGGGLGRELAYLPARQRVSAAFAKDPGLERFFERGRVSIAAARVIQKLEKSAS